MFDEKQEKKAGKFLLCKRKHLIFRNQFTQKRDSQKLPEKIDDSKKLSVNNEFSYKISTAINSALCKLNSYYVPEIIITKMEKNGKIKILQPSVYPIIKVA